MNNDFAKQQPQPNEKDRTKPGADCLELFAEELPTQHDLLGIACASSLSSASTAVTSTVGTGGTFSTISG